MRQLGKSADGFTIHVSDPGGGIDPSDSQLKRAAPTHHDRHFLIMIMILTGNPKPSLLTTVAGPTTALAGTLTVIENDPVPSGRAVPTLNTWPRFVRRTRGTARIGAFAAGVSPLMTTSLHSLTNHCPTTFSEPPMWAEALEAVSVGATQDAALCVAGPVLGTDARLPAPVRPDPQLTIPAVITRAHAVATTRL